MTNAELNRKVKKFAKQIKDGTIDPKSVEAKKEFTTLHGADPSFRAFNADSLRAMIIINRKYQYEPFHMFAVHAEL